MNGKENVSKKEGASSNSSQKPSNDRNGIFRKRRRQRHQEFLQYTSLISLIAYIIVACYQGCKTQESLQLTRESIDKNHYSDSLNRILTEKSIKQTENASDTAYVFSKKSLAISEVSLDASKKNSETYESLTKADLRAYVVVEEIILEKIQTGKPFYTIANIINCGKTPAFNVKIFSMLTICIDTTDITKTYTELLAMLNRHKKEGTILGSNNSISKEIILNQIISKEDSIAWTNDKCKINVIIGIQYYDIFDKECHSIGCYITNINDDKFYAYKDYNWAD